MSNDLLIIKSPEHLLAQVHAMKCESEDRLQDLIDSLTQHNNMAAADIFSRTHKLIKLSVQNIEQKAQGMQLPEIPPWESQWHCNEQPDCLCIENAHYLMTPVQALDLAIFNEKRLLVFFKQQTEIGFNENIRLIANELLIHENQLTKQMQSWREHLEKSETEQQNEDFDPPNIPE